MIVIEPCVTYLDKTYMLNKDLHEYPLINSIGLLAKELTEEGRSINTQIINRFIDKLGGNIQ